MIHMLGLAVIAVLLSAGLLHEIKLPDKLPLIPFIQLPIKIPASQSCWTEWFDRDDPSGTGDWELLSNLRTENPGKICEKPTDIEAMTTSGLTPAAAGDVFTMSPVTGFVCKLVEQKDKQCNDYRVRFRCYSPFCAEDIETPSNQRCWTEWFDRDNPSGTGDWELLSNLRSENPGKICEKPTDIEVETMSGLTPASTGEVVTMDKDTGFVCKNMDQPDKMCDDYRVRFSCYSPFCAEVCWTEWFDRDNPSGTGDWELLSDLQKEYPGIICDKPKFVEAVTVSDNIPAVSTGQDFIIYSPTKGFVCKNVLGKQYCKDYKVRFGCCC